MKFFKIFILAIFAFTLIACGGAEERKSVYMEKAKSSIKAGDLDKARIELKNVLQIDPKDAEAYYQLGKVYEQQKEYRKAYTHYLKAEGLDPDLLVNQAMLGRIYLLLANDDAKAQEKIDFILEKDPENRNGLLLKSTLMLKNNKILEGTEIAKKVVDENPDYIDGATFLATLYFKDKKPQQAIEVLDKALALNPGDETLNKLLAIVLVNQKEYNRAEVIYKSLLEKHPDSRNSYNILAAFYETSGDEVKSEEVLRSSINNDPEDVERYLTLVKYIKLKKGVTEAINELKSLVSSKPGIGKLRMALAELFMISGDKDSAIAVYKEIINDFPDELSGVEARISLASVYLSDKDVKQAGEVVEDAVSVSPNDPKVNFLRAKIALFNKDIEKAIISLRIVTKEMPENINAFFLLAGAYQLEGNNEQVVSTLNAAYENNRSNPEALLRLAEHYVTKDLSLAGKIIDDYNNLKKSDYDGMAIKASILNRKKLYSDAYAISEKLIKLYADKIAGYLHATPYLVQQGDLKKAISVLQQGYGNTEDNRILLVLLTKLLVSDKQFDVAEKLIKDELNASPDDSNLKIILAKIYLAKNDLFASESLLKEVIKSEPASEEAYLLLAEIYQKQKNISSVKSILEKGKSNIASSIKIPLRLATAYEFNKEYQKTIVIYRELNELHPENLIIVNNLVSILSEYGNKSDLESAKKLAVKLDGTEQPVFMDTIGWLYYKLGDSQSAIQYLSQAVEKASNISVFNYHLGMAYKQAGDNQQAKLYLEKSIADGKNFKEKEQAKTALKNL